jgi:hypothetical protein
MATTGLSRKIICTLFFILFFCLKGICQPPAVYKSESGEVTFFSYAPLEDIKAVSKQVNSFINISNYEFAFMIPVRSFRFAKSLMEEHFNEKYLESDKFPQATFKGIINEKVDLDKNGKYDVTATGKMHIHGVEKEITEKAQLEVSEGKMNLLTDFKIILSDYKISKPQIMFNNIADTIDVKLKAVYVPFRNK